MFNRQFIAFTTSVAYIIICIIPVFGEDTAQLQSVCAFEDVKADNVKCVEKYESIYSDIVYTIFPYFVFKNVLLV